MRGEDLSNVVGLSCGTVDDQLIVLHMSKKNDLVACLPSPPPRPVSIFTPGLNPGYMTLHCAVKTNRISS